MATKPVVQNLNASSVDILNAIRNNASTNYKDYVPQARADAASVREIGAILMDYPALQNEFVSALVNRIGMVLITSKMYSNPWSVFKQGLLDFGETIEEIFVNLAQPFEYDPAVAENNVFKRQIPDVRAAFHVLNYKKFYKTTIQNEELRLAFLSWNGVSDLIARIVDSMYSAAAYDEFQTMKYMLAKHILSGHLSAHSIPAVSAENMKAITAEIKAVSNNFTFMSPDYNISGVQNFSNKENQYVIMNSAFDAAMGVEVLASAFNMDKADFMGHRLLVDGFGRLDTVRLGKLFADDPTYKELTAAELEAVNAVPVVVVDEKFFMIYDNLYNFTEQYNGEGMYWNYWYHVWKTFSVSPFANAAAFIPGTPSVTSVTVSPTAVTVGKGQSVQLTATVATENFASQSVTWSIDADEGATISASGLLTVDNDFAGTTIIATATSVADGTKTATATVTVA